MLGLALAGVGDRVSAQRVDSRGVTISEVRGLNGEIHPYLSTDPEHNTASIAAQALWNDYGDDAGVELIVYKGVPLQSGMGSSAASAAKTHNHNAFSSSGQPVVKPATPAKG